MSVSVKNSFAALPWEKPSSSGEEFRVPLNDSFRVLLFPYTHPDTDTKSEVSMTRGEMREKAMQMMMKRFH